MRREINFWPNVPGASAIVLSAALAVTAMAPAATAADEQVVLGALTDMSGPYSSVTGAGWMAAVELAIEDAGGTALGKPVKLLTGDNQLKPQVAVALVQKWLEADGMTALIDGSSSNIALADNEIMRTAGKIMMASAAGTTDLTGKACAPYTTQWGFDSFAMSAGGGQYLADTNPNSKWFFLTADYTYGANLQANVEPFIARSGGEVIGTVRTPLGATDFSSFVLQAGTSDAQIIGLAMAGSDLLTTIKQLQEFGFGDKKVAALNLWINDVDGIGLQAGKGLIAGETFYWDRTDASREWLKRFRAKAPNALPNGLMVGAYSATLHYLKAVNAVGTTDAAKVSEEMKRTAVNDFNNDNAVVRQDGRVLHRLYVIQVKAPEESKGEFDYYKIIGEIPGDKAFTPLEAGNCPLVK